MIQDLEQIKQKLLDLLSPKNGYFGRVYTWGQEIEKYHYIGYELTSDVLPLFKKMSDDQIKNLIAIMNYFEIHAKPLKCLLSAEKNGFDSLYYEIAWSHFMTVIMFGMLEIATKGKVGAKLNDKGKKIKNFLTINLSKKIQHDIASRYVIESNSNKKVKKSFSDVFDNLWVNIRCGFVHDAGISYKGLEWMSLGGGIGTRESPLRIQRDVPMQELLQITWQAILNSYGYRGKLKLPLLKH